MLWDGLHSLGLKSFVEKEENRLSTVNTIKVGRPNPQKKDLLPRNIHKGLRKNMILIPLGWQSPYLAH